MERKDIDGPRLMGHIEAHGIKPSDIARRLELNEEYVLKVLRGTHPVRFDHVLAIGILIGEHKSR